jgi:hypothetical protein
MVPKIPLRSTNSSNVSASRTGASDKLASADKSYAALDISQIDVDGIVEIESLRDALAPQELAEAT